MHREYSRAKEGLVSVIIDSYDKAKLSLPRFPFGRVPKKSIYEETRRAWTSSSFLLNFKLRQKFCLCCVVCFTTWCISVVLRVCFEKKKRGTYLTLTAVICHGWGCFMYLSSEALSEGSNWNWECVPRHSLNVLECLCDGSVFFWNVFVLWQLSKNERYYGLWTLSMPELWSWISHSPVSSLVEI